MLKKNGHKPSAGAPVKAVIYRRVSSERQGERVSPEEQLADCQSYAAAHGYVVTAVYTDIDRYRSRGRLVEPSGTRVDRPGFVSLLADGAAGRFDVILAWKADRLYRGVKPAVLVDDLMEQTGIRLELVRETFDRKTQMIMAAIGRMEIENIRERTEMGMKARVRSGMIHGGPVPAGYLAVKGDDGTAAGYVLDPAWRVFFDDLARYYLERLSLAEIARRLGTNSRTGRPWQSGQLSYLLRNPFYRGQIAYGWQSGQPEFTVTGRHEPAWDAETCRAIEREVLRRGGRHNTPRGLAILSGILRCGYCGHAMKSGITTSHTPIATHRYRVYGCDRPTLVKDGRWAGRASHAPNYINERRVLKLIAAYLAGLTEQSIDERLAQAAAALGGPAPDDSQRQDALTAEAERLAERLADLTVGLEGVRHQSPAATEAIVAAITAAGRQLDHVRAELEQLAARRTAAPDLARARAALLQLIADPDLLARPGDELRNKLRDAFPALYIARGQIVAAVVEWHDAPQSRAVR